MGLWAACSVTWAVLVTLAVPVVLDRGSWWSQRPRQALVVWSGAVLSSVVALVLAVACGLLHLDRHVVDGSVPASVALLAQWAVAGLAIGLLALVMRQVELMVHASIDTRRALRLLERTHGVAQEHLDGVTIVTIDAALPMAFCAPGRPPRIFVTSAIESRVTIDEYRAIIAHERAHLRQRHLWLVGFADFAVALTPWLGASRRMRRAVGVLVELAADDAAGRSAGVGNVASALRALGAGACGGASTEVRARRLLAR